MRLSVIVPTIGRSTLERALRSVGPRKDDELIVVQAGGDPEVERICQELGCTYLAYRGEPTSGGDSERQRGIEHASGDYLVFLDDDDVMAPGGLEIVREEVSKLDAPTPLLFRIRIPGGYTWGDEGPSLTVCEVSGSQFVPPNSNLPEWPVDPYGDHLFINRTVERWNGYRAVDRVIILIRPEQIV